MKPKEKLEMSHKRIVKGYFMKNIMRLHTLVLFAGLAMLVPGVSLAAGSGGGGTVPSRTCSTIQSDSVTSQLGVTAARIRSAITVQPCVAGGGVYTGTVTITNLDTNTVEFVESLWFTRSYSVNISDAIAKFGTHYRVDLTTSDPSGNPADTRTTTIVTPGTAGI
jgi:hypothetical protein